MAGLLSRRATWRATDERGVSLVTAMVITLTVFAIGGIWITLATHQYSASARERQRQQALSAAEAGLNQAMSGLSADAGLDSSKSQSRAKALRKLCRQDHGVEQFE